MQKMRENSLSTLIVYICNFRNVSLGLQPH
nr:MAG TPA: hypothetical protein [Bacteriophage sp.]